MAFKFIALATLVAAASAGYIPAVHQSYHVEHTAPVVYAHAEPIAYAAPVHHVIAKSHEPEHHDSHPQYEFSYGVHDSHTGDVKNQHESRNGDAVKGSYSFVEADGSRRVVHYTADDHHGFNAVVENEPAKVAVKAVAPVAYHAAPVAHVAVAYHAAPVAHASVAYHAAPVAHAPAAYHAAPVAHAPVAYHAAPVAHATVAYHAAPVAHAPAAYHAAPVAHHAVPVSYASYDAPASHEHGSESHGYAPQSHGYASGHSYDY